VSLEEDDVMQHTDVPDPPDVLDPLDAPDRPPIDAALVERLIAEQFPAWSGLPFHEVDPQGWDNRTDHGNG
jgi:hypothetical protein